MKRTGLLAVVATAVSTVAFAQATYNTNYVSLKTEFSLGGDPINVAAACVFDPSSKTNGNYNRVYLVNKSKDPVKYGLYMADLEAETYTPRLALGDANDSTHDFRAPNGICMDTDGAIYVDYVYKPMIYKVTDPLGSATEHQVLGNYGGGGDDDPSGVLTVPTGFGGGYVPGKDIIIVDSGIDANHQEGLAVVRTSVTDTDPETDIIWDDAVAYRTVPSPFDGKIYAVRIPAAYRAPLNGELRAYLLQFDASGNEKRVFLNIDPDQVFQIDDAVDINPADGSLWMNIQDVKGPEPDQRKLFRVDLAHAVATNDDLIADVQLVVENVGYNIGKNGMSFSPDGSSLALASPSDQDRMLLYDTSTNAPYAVFNKSFFTTDTNQTTISTSGAVVYDPTSTSNGVYNRVYLMNRVTDVATRGVYAIDTLAETVSPRLALSGVVGSTTNNLDRPVDITIDASGAIYVAYGYTPAIWKVVDPMGAATESQMLGNYGIDTTDDDPECIGMMPDGSGDLVLADNGLDENGRNTISIVDASSTASSPSFTTIWDTGAGDEGIRAAASEYEGYIYAVRWHFTTIDPKGPFVDRIDSGGAVQRIYLRDLPATVDNLDDGLAINPADGSLWMNVDDSTAAKDLIRVDVANAVESNNDWYASCAVAISGGHNISQNGIAFSPDGKLLAMPNPDGADMMSVYNIVVHAPSPFHNWIGEYGLGGADAAADADPDGDGLDNIYEFGLGGDPTNTADQGMSPSFTAEGGAGSVTYVYPKRLDSGLVYRLEINDDLVYGDWLDSGYTVVGTGSIDSEFDAVTNQVSTAVKNEQFIRLIIEE